MDEDTTTDEAQVEQVQDNDTTDANDNEAEGEEAVEDDGSEDDAEAGATADVAGATTADTTQDAGQAEDDDDDEIATYQPQSIQVAPLDFSKLPTDADGNIEPTALAQAMAEHDKELLAAARAQSRDENMQIRQEDTLWKKAEKQYPQITENREIRKLVQDTRYGIIASGKNATPLEAAQRIFKHIGEATRNGAKTATENVRVQRSAALETSSTRSATTSPRDNLMKRVTGNNRTDAATARRELLESYIADGSIKTRT